jgi:hypothetical protein
MPRPFLVKQLDGGALPFRLVGTHRRILFKDLMDYKRTIDGKRQDNLKVLTAQAQDLNIGY